MNKNSKNIALWVILGLLLIGLFNLYQGPNWNVRINSMDFSDLVSNISKGHISEVLIQGDQITGKFHNGRPFRSYVPPHYYNLVEQLVAHDVRIKSAPIEEATPSLLQIFLSWFPMLLLVGVWIFFLRQVQGGTGRAMGFGKSKARLMTEQSKPVTFLDVAGIEEAKDDLQEIVDFLQEPKKFQKLGGEIPKGVLLIGPPGTGKTLLARAIAGEAGVPFFSISGSDFVEMFVGVGASRVRDMFEQGKQNAPCIIFIDEIDAVGRHRGAGMGGGNDEREQTLNQLLVEMDGFESNEGVILIAATNRPDVLDPALLRPGRFDRQIIVPNPDIVGREKILGVHMRKVPLSSDVDTKIVARGTPGFSGADLANLVNEAALLAARRSKKFVSMAEFEDAKDKVMMGAERRSLVMSDEERKLTAYHEAGHAVVAFHSPASDPIHKATIIPRGKALGLVMRLPERDQISISRERLMADLAVAMGGRIAEELIFGEAKVTTGASSDIKMATDMARRMVTEWGMSAKLGPLTYGRGSQEVFMGHSVGAQKNISEATAEAIDQEVHRLVTESYETAKNLLVHRSEHLELIAQNLLEYETLSGDKIRSLLVEGHTTPEGSSPKKEPVKKVSKTGKGSTKTVSDSARSQKNNQE